MSLRNTRIFKANRLGPHYLESGDDYSSALRRNYRATGLRFSSIRLDEGTVASVASAHTGRVEETRQRREGAGRPYAPNAKPEQFSASSDDSRADGPGH